MSGGRKRVGTGHPEYFQRVVGVSDILADIRHNGRAAVRRKILQGKILNKLNCSSLNNVHWVIGRESLSGLPREQLSNPSRRTFRDFLWGGRREELIAQWSIYRGNIRVISPPGAFEGPMPLYRLK